MNNIFVKHFL